MADPSMRLPEGKTCGDCAHIERCTTVLGCTSRTATSCDWAPSRFIERPRAPAPRAAGYVSPLWPPPGDPRAAHGDGCPLSCPCRAAPGGRRLAAVQDLSGELDAHEETGT